ARAGGGAGRPRRRNEEELGRGRQRCSVQIAKGGFERGRIERRLLSFGGRRRRDGVAEEPQQRGRQSGGGRRGVGVIDVHAVVAASEGAERERARAKDLGGRIERVIPGTRGEALRDRRRQRLLQAAEQRDQPGGAGDGRAVEAGRLART